MSKKIIFSLIVILILVVGGGFFLWQNQKDVRELNKGLPKGVRVVKSLIGKEYRVVNKIDGYEIKVPKAWEGLKEIEYSPERKVNGMKATGIVLTAPVGGIIGIDQYKINQETIDLEMLVKDFFEPEGLLEKQQIGDYETIRTEAERLAGAKIYFFQKDLKIYTIGGFSDENIREIILNGKW